MCRNARARIRSPSTQRTCFSFTNLACKYAEHTLMYIHDWIIGSFVIINHWIGMESNNQIVAMFFRLFEEVQVTDVE